MIMVYRVTGYTNVITSIFRSKDHFREFMKKYGNTIEMIVLF